MSDRIERTIPGATTEDLANWAHRIEETNPVTHGFPPFRPKVGVVLTDQPFMGIELTFMAGRRELFVLALFADIATEKETEVMNATSETSES